MKKLTLCLVVTMCLMVLPLSLLSYTITDSPNDSIGYPTFESYGINMYNFTPPTYSGDISFDLFTNYYPPTGVTVGSWTTYPADLFITETWHGNQYLWAIPLVDHGGFIAGNMYAVGSYRISDSFEPQPPGGYSYNHNVPVWIDTLGNNYGFSSFGGYTPVWTNLVPPGHPDWSVRLQIAGLYEDDPNGQFSLYWGTSTCGNDVVNNPVPEPASMLLFGSGLFGMAAALRRKFKK